MAKTVIPPLELYCGLMEEIKGRVEWIKTISSGRVPLPPQLAREYCTLQIRMVCELVAIGCLAVHNDTSDVKALEKQWSANEIIPRLEKLNPHFFPRACVVNRVGEGFDIKGLSPQPLNKTEFLTIYGRCGGGLHRGDLRRILSSIPPQPVKFDDIVEHTTKIMRLLDQHRIASADYKTHYVCVMVNGPPGSKAAMITAQNVPGLPPPRPEVDGA